LGYVVDIIVGHARLTYSSRKTMIARRNTLLALVI
jgi:hypothetical protein